MNTDAGILDAALAELDAFNAPQMEAFERWLQAQAAPGKPIPEDQEPPMPTKEPPSDG